MDNFNKLTEKAQEAVVRAQAIAREHSASEIDAEHLLAALLEDPEGVPRSSCASSAPIQPASAASSPRF